MKNLEAIYNIKRKDLETSDYNIVQNYSKIIKKHKNLDIRLNKKKSNILSINKKSIQTIFDFLENELPEEHILFLFEKKEKEHKNNKKEKEEYIINTKKENEDKNEENEEKKNFLTLEVENPVLKKFKTLTHQIMKKYYFIFCILCFIIAILFTIHLFLYIISKEVNNNNYIIFYSLNFVNI